MERPLLTPVAVPSPRERRVRLRLMLVAFSICLWAVVVVLRLVQLQLFGRDAFARQASRQSERTINLDPRRGAVLDRNRKQLAVSVDAESIYAVPQEVRNAGRTAAALARALELDAAARKELTAQLQRNRAFVWVRRKVDPMKARAVRDLQLEGIGFLTENRRYYPRRELASQVLGYVGLDNTGMSGIEYAFEDLIRGKAAKVTVHIDARRRPLGSIDRPSTDGHTVVLTLDERIQYLAERELEKAVAETGAQSGQAVVLVPRTGEILALAHRPTFNPNRFGAYPSARWRNRAVTDVIEPGSVFKIFTAAAALQEKVVDPDEVIDCGGGGIDIAGTRINDHHAYDQLTFRGVIAKSSNVGAIRVAQRVGREGFNRYLREFGFGAPTGVDLPGESAGLLRPTSRWSALSLPSMSFGQEIGVTALQIATAVGAVANGGYLMKPMIVRQIEDSEGRVVRVNRPVAVRHVLESSTADTLTDLLRGVVKDGTGRRAAVPGYVVAGKTGTAQKLDASGRYSMVDHLASFVGFVPASQPALVILVSLDTPRGERNEAGDVAAPLFARIAEQALRHLAVPPDDPERTLRLATYRPSVAAPAAWQGEPARVEPVAQPAASSTDRADRAMPDLRGRSAREAAIEAARRGLIVELRGSGQVFAQRPEPGTEVVPGTHCVLTLRRPAAADVAGGAGPMTLRELAARLPGAEVAGDDSVAITAVTHDSRKAGPGVLFVAVRGTSLDGNQFVDAARKKGAAAIASEDGPRPGVPWLKVSDAREALATLSAEVLGRPGDALRLVGVTGTNGKTTTTYLIDAALRAAGHKTGLIGTVQYRIGDRLAEATRTTPESSDLQVLFREMVDAGCDHAVLEVSSHSLDLKRVHGCAFDVAVYTNLTRDHLDFHGDMDRYFVAKRRLFDTNLRTDGHAVINLDDDRAAELIAASRGRVWTYSVSGGPADLQALDIRLSLDATRFRARTPAGDFEVRTPLLGRFNVENLLAALGAALALGLDPLIAIGGLSSVGGVPGRLERVLAGQDFTVVVDYAHTDDALKNLLETVRELKPRRLITVFGCGGDRDRTKRPLMGAVAARLSDVVIVTSDNPRSEPPEAILEEIQRGMNGGRRAERHAIVDRREAIVRALEMAGSGDAVVIAGKGHETYQVLRDRTVPFDDRQIAREVLTRLARSGKA